MKERENYMLCCDCGFAVKKSTMFIKQYRNTAICLCKKCATSLCLGLVEYWTTKELEKGGANNDR